MVGFGSARGLELLELETFQGSTEPILQGLSGCCTPRPSYVVLFGYHIIIPYPKTIRNPKGTTLEPYISRTKGFVGHCLRKGFCFESSAKV